MKLSFALDKDSGLPCGYSVYKQRDSNRSVIGTVMIFSLYFFFQNINSKIVYILNLGGELF